MAWTKAFDDVITGSPLQALRFGPASAESTHLKEKQPVRCHSILIQVVHDAVRMMLAGRLGILWPQP